MNLDPITPAERANFDRQMARARDVVIELVAYTRTLDVTDQVDMIENLSYEVAGHVVRLSHDEESSFGATIGLLIAAVLQLAEQS